MSNLSFKPVLIEILSSNKESERFNILPGNKYKALREHVNGKPTIKCVFRVPEALYDRIAYLCDHDEDALIPVTTCKLITE